MARPFSTGGYKIPLKKWKRVTESGSGVIAPLSYTQQLCRQILADNAKAKATHKKA